MAVPTSGRWGTFPRVSTETTSSAARPATAIDHIADDFLARFVELSPISATYLGITGHDEEIDDFSPAGHEAHATLRAETLAQLDRATPVDDIDRVTLAAMRERLGVAEETHRAGLDEMALNVIASPLQSIRGCFDLMPTATDEDWGTLSRRLERVPEAISNWQVSLLSASARGHIAPRRQVEACIQQCVDLAADDGYFATLVAGARLSQDTGPGELAASTKDTLTSAAEAASAAYAELGGGSPTTCSTTHRSRTPAVRRPTRCSPGRSSARRSTSPRPTPGVSRRSPASRPRWSRSPSRSSPAAP